MCWEKTSALCLSQSLLMYNLMYILQRSETPGIEIVKETIVFLICNNLT